MKIKHLSVLHFLKLLLTNKEPLVANNDKKTDTETLLNILQKEIGITPDLIKSIIFLITTMIILGIQITYLSSHRVLIMHIQSITDIQINYLNFALLFGLGIGGIMCLFLSKNRTLIIKATTLGLALASLGLIIFYSNYYCYLILRFLTGTSLGILSTIQTSVVTEKLESLPSFRGLILQSIFSTIPIGQLLPYGILLMFYNPGWKPFSQLREILILIELLPSFLALFVLFFFRDSFRNLILDNQECEALTMLEETYFACTEKYIDDLTKMNILQEVKSNNFVLSANNPLHTNSYSINNIFTYNPFMFLNIALLWSLGSIISLTPQILLSYNISHIEGFLSKNPIINISIAQLLILAVRVPGYLLSGLLSESFLFKRKLTMIIGCLFMGIILIKYLMFLGFIEESIALRNPVNADKIVVRINFFFICLSSFLVPFLLLLIVLSYEVYPTNLRDQAGGVFYFISRLMSSCCFAFFQTIETKGIKLCISILILICACFIILTTSLNIESYKKPIDYCYFKPIESKPMKLENKKKNLEMKLS